jgi:hypothetical protein
VLTGQMHRVAGVIMLLLVATLIIALFTAETPDTDAANFPADFQDVVDNEVTYLIGQSMQVLTGVFVALLGAALCTIFWNRDRFLALVGFTGFMLMAALFVVSAAANVGVHSLANNLDAGDTLAGEQEIFEIARTLTDLGDGTFFLGLIFFAIGLLGFGAMIGIAPVRPPITEPVPGPDPLLTPPKWLGWLAMLAGILYLLGWFALAADIFFVFIIIAFFLTILWYLTFGIWLIRYPSATNPQA